MTARVPALVVSSLLVAAPAAVSQVPESERVRVNDPARLEAMGFAPDATNVYVWTRARLGQDGDEGPAPAPESTFGGATGLFSYAGMPSFQGNSNAFAYDTSAQGVFCQAGTPA